MTLPVTCSKKQNQAFQSLLVYGYQLQAFFLLLMVNPAALLLFCFFLYEVISLHGHLQIEFHDS